MEYLETDCTIEHEGRKFESGGAVVTGNAVFVYLKGNTVTDWHGKVLGNCRVLSWWRTPRSAYSPRMYSVEFWIDGVRYVGRSGGDGMMLRGKRSPRQTPEGGR